MKIYLVGGAVRDKLLGIDSKDKDFVVVGSSVKEMLDLDYQQVGKDFPVFLHPQTKDEYALARVERKVGKGYAGFEFDTKSVSLKDDLSRRDLTINSMAIDENGELIDYFGGAEDLQNGLLKHTSKAFIEDPVRVLRIAKFHARFKKYGFKVAHSTFALLKKMVASGEVDNLISERVFAELSEVLSYQAPSYFFQTLVSCGAYEKIFGLTHEHSKTHQNNFTFLDNLEILPEMKFAIWLQKYTTHEVKQVCKKLGVPKKYKELALLTNGFFDYVVDFNSSTAEQKLEFFSKTDSTRRFDRFNKLLSIFKTLRVDINAILHTNMLLKNIDVSKLDKNNIAQEIKIQRLKICKM